MRFHQAEAVIAQIKTIVQPHGIGMSDKCSPVLPANQQLERIKAAIRDAEDAHVQETAESELRAINADLARHRAAHTGVIWAAAPDDEVVIADPRVLSQDEIDALLGFDDTYPQSKPSGIALIHTAWARIATYAPTILISTTCATAITLLLNHW